MGRIVYFDLETTGLNHRNRHEGVEIISIGAVSMRGQRFINFIHPTCPIMPGATSVHGMTSNGMGQLIDKYGQVVATVGPREGILAFLHFLQEVGCQYLVAHNNFRFDWIVLNNNFEMFGIEHPIIDQLTPLDSQVFIQDNFSGLPSYSLENCLRHICEREQRNAHDALSDSYDCKNICETGARSLGFRHFMDYIRNHLGR